MAPKGTNLALVINVCDGLEKYLHFIIRTKVALSFYLYNSVCLFAYSFVLKEFYPKNGDIYILVLIMYLTGEPNRELYFLYIKRQIVSKRCELFFFVLIGVIRTLYMYLFGHAVQ